MASGADWGTVKKLGEFEAEQSVIESYIVNADMETAQYGSLFDTTELKTLTELRTAHLLQMSLEPQLQHYSHAGVTAIARVAMGQNLDQTGFGQQYQRLLNSKLASGSVLSS